jgi:hypothetical protein
MKLHPKKEDVFGVVDISVLDERGDVTDATGRVLVGALGVGPELAVLVAAGVGVLGAEQAGVALLVALDAQVAAERLLGLREAATGFRQQHLTTEEDL